MKTVVFLFFIVSSLYIFSCKNNDTTTQMPDGGYKERTDSMSTAADSLSGTKDKGAVAVDTIKNGQAVISGATSDSAK